jgi:hypothetical protein
LSGIYFQKILISKVGVPLELKLDLKTPRRMRCRVIAEKKSSTALSQDAEVGGKWKTHLGWSAGQSIQLCQ